MVAIKKEKLYNMFESLDKNDKKTVYDFMQFLNERSYWKKIDESESDEEPLSKEELEQLKSREGFMTGEDAKREYNIQTDLP